MTVADLFLKVHGYNEVMIVDDSDDVTGTRDVLARMLKPSVFARKVDCIRTEGDGTLVIELAADDEEDEE